MLTRGILCGLVVSSVVAGCSSDPAPQFPQHATVAELGKAISTATAAQGGASLKFQEDGRDTGSGSYSQYRDTSAVDVTLTTVMEVRLISMEGGTYFKGPSSMALDPRKPWMKLSADGQDEVSRFLGPGLLLMKDDANVGRTLTLDADAATMRPPTAEEMDGVAANRYVITVDVRKLATVRTDRLSVKAAEAAVQHGERTRTLTIWVDEHDLPVRIETRSDAKDTPPETTLYSHWGTQTVISAPSADKITILSGG